MPFLDGAGSLGCYHFENLPSGGNYHVDGSYYCPSWDEGVQCYVCDSGYQYEADSGSCMLPCSTGSEGCTQTLGPWESGVGAACPEANPANDICVDCLAGGTWDKWCESCYETCPAGTIGQSFTGCINTGQPANSVQRSSDDSCFTGSLVYSCDNSDPRFGGNKVCYQCNTRLIWNGLACVPGCVPLEGACTGTGGEILDECCAGTYCSEYMDLGRPNNDPHCCPVGWYWSNVTNFCMQEQVCAAEPKHPEWCNQLSDFPFNPPLAWWDEPECIDQSQGCCFTDIFNPDCSDPLNYSCYNYLYNEAY